MIPKSKQKRKDPAMEEEKSQKSLKKPALFTTDSDKSNSC